MTARLGPILERGLALVLLASVLYALAAFVALPIKAHHDAMEEDLAQRRDLIDRLARSIVNRGGLEAREGALREAISESGIFLDAGTEALAAAELQIHLTAAVEAAGGDLRSLHVLPSRIEGPLARIAMRAVIGASHEEILRILYDLETGRPYLFVETLRIDAEKSRRRARTLRDSSAYLLNLDVAAFAAAPGGGG